MPAKPVLTPVPARPSRGEPMDAPSGVEEAFREFRQSAVRLVERVNDALGLDQKTGVDQLDNLRRVRAIFGKWSADILLALHTTPGVGFEELRRSLPGISPRVLSLKLKDLEENGMIRREIIESRPPRAKYTLTDRGWTVAWLAQPVFLYLKLTMGSGGPSPSDGNRTPDANDLAPPVPRATAASVPPRSWRSQPDKVVISWKGSMLKAPPRA